jgi:hypothetical protein
MTSRKIRVLGKISCLLFRAGHELSSRTAQCTNAHLQYSDSSKLSQFHPPPPQHGQQATDRNAQPEYFIPEDGVYIQSGYEIICRQCEQVCHRSHNYCSNCGLETFMRDWNIPGQVKSLIHPDENMRLVGVKRNHGNVSSAARMEDNDTNSAKKPKLNLEFQIRLKKKMIVERKDYMAKLIEKTAKDEEELDGLIAMHHEAAAQASVEEEGGADECGFPASAGAEDKGEA